MFGLLGKLLGVTREAVTGRSVSSVMRPFYVILILIVPLSLVLAYKLGAAGAPFFYLAAGSLLAFFIAWFYFAIKDPQRLHSETYILGQRRLDVLEAKGQSSPMPPYALELLSNPEPLIDKPQLPPRSVPILDTSRVIDTSKGEGT
jgi:hypothetical protein